nr:D-alanyl-D-alanine carboxypeptidase family protein [uncultured Blautia sp.]
MIIIKSGIWICIFRYQAAGCQMKGIQRKAAGLLGLLFLVSVCVPAYGKSKSIEVQMIPNLVDMVENSETDGPGSLYALSAVLMDGDSGRILYQKDGEVPRPNASTTKVLTCILALENGNGDDYVSVSKKAASQPEVRLNLHEGEQYYLEDLLYSLMLKSHNDTAVAIAEHIGGSVEGFADMMNAKAKEIGCKDTYFITPNGLDASDTDGVHHTTAADLARIMDYAIQNPAFLKITQTRDYSFSDLSGKRHFSVHNANAFLDMEEGVLSGKTGFTGNAGYCYVCACKNQERTFIIALLGCGWPGNKNYKWQDTKKLLKYGETYFRYENYWKELKIPRLFVKDGATEKGGFGQKVWIQGELKARETDKEKKVLIRTDEKVSCSLKLAKELQAPVQKGQKIGEVRYRLGDELLAAYPVVADRGVDRISYPWCVDQVFHVFFHS